ncbi:MAG: 50S ribosomal protein L18 [Chloroflexota bacterium]|nr:MAG: 50S ribosomal protein L18 [Chloroflexota bacterium]
MFKQADSRAARIKRHRRVRAKVVGTPERPRLSVFRSLKHMQAQIIEDSAGHTQVAASTLDPEVKELAKGKSKIEQAKIVGQLLARRSLDKGIERVVFDRGGYLYHGRVKALAEAAREGGLVF